MTTPANFPTELMDRYTFKKFWDFDHLVTAQDGLTTLVADAGTSITVADTENGIAPLTTGATDNNEVAVRTTAELYLVEANRSMYAAALFQYAEANTDDANIAFGFGSAVAANFMVDDGAGMRTTGNYFVIYKIDGGTVWRARSRNGTETEDNVSDQTAGHATAFQLLEVYIDEQPSTEVLATYKVNGAFLKDESTGLNIVHRINVSGSTEMNLALYVKAGGATSEVVNLDWFYGGQTRNAAGGF